MVFLRRVFLGDKEYFYLFYTQKVGDSNEKFSRFIGDKKPSPKKLESLKSKFKKDVNSNPGKYMISDRPNVLALLQTIQEENGYISNANFIKSSKELGISAVDLVGVATFYSQFKLKPPAKYKLKICDGTACHVQGSVSLLDLLDKELGLKPGETSADGLFSLEIVRCLGVCASAPVMLVNEKLYSKLTVDRIAELIKELKTK